MSDRHYVTDDSLRSRLRQPDTRRAQSFRGIEQRQTVRPRIRSTPQSIIQAAPPIEKPVTFAVSTSPKVSPKVEPVAVVAAQPFARPAAAKQQHSNVLRRQIVAAPTQATSRGMTSRLPRQKVHVALVAMAVFIFALGIVVSLQTVLTNRNATAQVAALSKRTIVDASSSPVTSTTPTPGTAKVSTRTLAGYTVPAANPRYLIIPKLKVDAIVLNLGLLSSGALATPPNVYETGWYNQSGKPGEPGAMLIDGHVSSWTTEGVFYGLKSLVPGDEVQVVRGDGQTFTYKVVATKVFTDSAADMQSAITPITAGKPGLNLITCYGKVKPGTSEFNDRIIVYTEQI